MRPCSATLFLIVSLSRRKWQNWQFFSWLLTCYRPFLWTPASCNKHDIQLWKIYCQTKNKYPRKKLALVFVTENFMFVNCLIRYLLMERFFITNGLSRWSVCWRKIKKQKNICLITMYLADFCVICHYLWFSIIKLISVAFD